MRILKFCNKEFPPGDRTDKNKEKIKEIKKILAKLLFTDVIKNLQNYLYFNRYERRKEFKNFLAIIICGLRILCRSLHKLENL